MLITTVPLLNLAEIFSISMLFSNLMVFTHLPDFNEEAITSAPSSSSNSSMYALKVASTVMSLSPASIEISSVEDDSRNVKEGSLFIAVSGYATDGHLYIQKAHTKQECTLFCFTK